MANHSLDGHIDQGKVFLEVVWYESNAALAVGEAVCYNYDYGTSTDREASRYNRVETPSTTNAQHFAGVSAHAYAAVSTGQFIEIYRPGSVCLINVAVSTEVGVGFVTFDVTTASVGQFRRMGLPGAGSAIPLEETTYGAAAQSCLAYLMEGPQSGGAEDVTAAQGAVTPMVGGSTFLIGAALGGACTIDLDDGTVEGLRKRYVQVDTDVSGGDIVITVTTGIGVEGTALGTITYNNAQTTLNMGVTLAWTLGGWNVTGISKGEPDLS